MYSEKRFEKISIELWSDKKFLSLPKPRPSARYLWLYLLTGEHCVTSLPGLYRIGKRTLAEALDWKPGTLLRHFSPLEKVGMVKADWKMRVVYLPNRIKHKMPDNENQIKNWLSMYRLIPECNLRTEFVKNVSIHLQSKNPERFENFCTIFKDYLPNGDFDIKNLGSAFGEYEKFFMRWNASARSNGFDASKIEEKEDLYQLYLERKKDVGFIRALETLVKKVSGSSYLTGKTKERFRASLYWILKNSENWKKVMNGGFDDKSKKS